MMDMPDKTEKKNNRVKGYAIWIGIYQDYIDGKKEIREINEQYRAPFVRG